MFRTASLTLALASKDPYSLTLTLDTNYPHFLTLTLNTKDLIPNT